MNIKKISMLLTGSACALCLISQDGMGSGKYKRTYRVSKNEQGMTPEKMQAILDWQNGKTSGNQANSNTEEFVLPTNANEVEALFKEKKAIPEDQRENVRKALDEFYKDDNDDQGKILLAESLEGDKDALNGYLSCFDKNLAAKIRDNVKDLEMKDGPLAIKIKDLEMKDGSLAIKIKSLEIVTASLNKW